MSEGRSHERLCGAAACGRDLIAATRPHHYERGAKPRAVMWGGRLWPRFDGEAVLLVPGREVDLAPARGAEVLRREVVDRVALHLVRADETAVDLVDLRAEEGVRKGECPVAAQLVGDRRAPEGEDRG